ncbi:MULTISPECIES: hypothetical protein [unclassified Acinetobacter]|uniref:hypothetical protein n=1 Tax=Acinetobacter TaxID=469 RepID=UPI0018A951AE|nr:MULTISPECIES: hypothetical protein [unclassified Acinetobacter]MBJ9953527.1 hypothetical protein [Acinetobacter baumannii]
MNIFIKQKAPAQLQQLCPLQSSFAYCLNQLRIAKIQFLNLGSLIICPEYDCLIVFKHKTLIRIDTFTHA